MSIRQRYNVAGGDDQFCTYALGKIRTPLPDNRIQRENSATPSK